MKSVIAFLTGLIFAFGLAIGGMTNPGNVRGFLDVAGNWNGSLMFVMAGAIAIHAIAFRFILRRNSPILDSNFHIPTRKDIDNKLILGSIIFGIGWGWAGICPGPGIVGLGSGKVEFFIFVLSMIVGMKAFQMFERKVYGK